MSQYYNPKRTRYLYDPASKAPFRLSRSKIDLFMECPRCFYLDRRMGVARPPGYPFNLNSAVDKLLKKEFDIHRAKGEAHPLMKKYNIRAIPIAHEKLNQWRENFIGVSTLHKQTHFEVFGAIDDLWKNEKGEYHVVDYKATSKDEEIKELNKDWQIVYKRQMEVYQWLLRKNNLDVSNIGYFVYCNGKTDAEAFDAKLEFDIIVIPYEGNDDWVDEILIQIHKCLNNSILPQPAKECDYCKYRTVAETVIMAQKSKKL